MTRNGCKKKSQENTFKKTVILNYNIRLLYFDQINSALVRRHFQKQDITDPVKSCLIA